MKTKILLGLILMFGICVSATDFECNVLGGNCSVDSTKYGNQEYIGITYYNTTVNVTISGNSAADVLLCNISCIVNKTHGNITNRSNGEIVNVSWCNLGATIISGSVRELFPRNITSYVTSDSKCNCSYSIWLNGTQAIIVEIKASSSREGSAGYPLIEVGVAASLLISAMIIRRWYKMRRT